MHFRVQLTIHLEHPLPAVDGNAEADAEQTAPAMPSSVTDYIMVMAVNARDAADALALAQERALAPDKHDVLRAVPSSYVQEAEIREIGDEELSTHPELATAPNVHERGVYHCSGRCFFSDAESGKRWWEFWKK
jgi:hypothetical protein